MNQKNSVNPVETLTTVAAPAFLPAPIIDQGLVRLGGQAPLFLPSQIANSGQMASEGQDVIADAGLVRLGGQSPIL